MDKQQHISRIRAILQQIERWDMLSLDPAGKGVATADAPFIRMLLDQAIALLD
jgi:hypothetical protein